jgi:alkyl sulfatase BDS1-like metallo-beta-lactamase superfamily hydrolase
MASVEECDSAFRALADRMDGADSSKHSQLDRTLSCTLTDLDVTFAGHLHDGTLTDIRQLSDGDASAQKAQVRLTMSSDDLVDLVAGRTTFATAWANRRVKIDASVLDLVRLRSIF